MNAENSTMGVGGFAFIALFLLILFALFNQNGLWGNRGNAFLAGEAFGGYGWNTAGDIRSAVCAADKQGIIDSARTLYAIEQQGNSVKEYLGNKMDFYAIQDLRDKLSDEKAKNLYLQGQLDNNARFYALDTKLNSISCNMCKKPELYCQSFTCDGTKIPSSTTAAA